MWRIGAAMSGGREPGGRDLVEQRLEDVVVAAVDQRDAHRRARRARGPRTGRRSRRRRSRRGRRDDSLAMRRGSFQPRAAAAGGTAPRSSSSASARRDAPLAVGEAAAAGLCPPARRSEDSPPRPCAWASRPCLRGRHRPTCWRWPAERCVWTWSPCTCCDFLIFVAVFALLTRRQRGHRAAVLLVLHRHAPGHGHPRPRRGLPATALLSRTLLHGGVVAAAVVLVFGLGLRRRPRRGVARLPPHERVRGRGLRRGRGIQSGTSLYLRGKPYASTLLDWMGPWPLYILVVQAVALMLFALLEAPLLRVARRGVLQVESGHARHRCPAPGPSPGGGWRLLAILVLPGATPPSPACCCCSTTARRGRPPPSARSAASGADERLRHRGPAAATREVRGVPLAAIGLVFSGVAGACCSCSRCWRAPRPAAAAGALALLALVAGRWRRTWRSSGCRWSRSRRSASCAC